MEMVPYDKRSGKIWFNGETIDWENANIHILIMDYIMPVVFLREKEFMMEKFLS